MVQTVLSPVEFPQVQFSDKDVDMAAVGACLALVVQTVQMPVEIPQAQFWDKDVFMPVVRVLYSAETCGVPTGAVLGQGC